MDGTCTAMDSMLSMESACTGMESAAQAWRACTGMEAHAHAWKAHHMLGSTALSPAVKGSAPVRKVAGLAIIMASEPPISNKHDVVALRLEHRGCAVAFHAGGRS
jgi:hypothetical protein